MSPRLLLLILFGVASANLPAQQNFFNVPSSEITEGGKIFLQQQFNIYRASSVSNTTFCYGIGHNYEIGVNLLGVTYDNAAGRLVSSPEGDEPVFPSFGLNVHKSGALMVHPFDATSTIEGQGTLAKEWEEDGALPDTLLVACGGGGLVAGIAAWWHGRVKIVAVEPEGSRCLHAALEAKEPVNVDVASIAADSLGAKRIGTLPFDIAMKAVDHVALVTDEAIQKAQSLLWHNFRLMIEPGGAAALAALVSGAYQARAGERVGVLLCGANVDPAKVIAS